MPVGVEQDRDSGRWYLVDTGGTRLHGPYLSESEALAAAARPPEERQPSRLTNSQITYEPGEPPVRSGVKIETTAKGMATLKVQVYEGTTEEEMQRLKDLAIRTYETATQELGQRAEFR